MRLPAGPVDIFTHYDHGTGKTGRLDHGATGKRGQGEKQEEQKQQTFIHKSYFTLKSAKFKQLTGFQIQIKKPAGLDEVDQRASGALKTKGKRRLTL